MISGGLDFGFFLFYYYWLFLGKRKNEKRDAFYFVWTSRTICVVTSFPLFFSIAELMARNSPEVKLSRRMVEFVSSGWWDHRLQMWIYNGSTVFVSTNSWSVARNHQKWEVCDWGIHLNCKTLISSSYFTASKNSRTRQTDEGWCLRRFCIPFGKTGFTG
jgi:hypothetical protein